MQKPRLFCINWRRVKLLNAKNVSWLNLAARVKDTRNASRYFVSGFYLEVLRGLGNEILWWYSESSVMEI
jgi:hypothetical protein